MPAYTFEALDAKGATQKGLIDADTARAARGMLRARALVPLSVEPAVGMFEPMVVAEPRLDGDPFDSGLSWIDLPGMNVEHRRSPRLAYSANRLARQCQRENPKVPSPHRNIGFPKVPCRRRKF